MLTRRRLVARHEGMRAGRCRFRHYYTITSLAKQDFITADTPLFRADMLRVILADDVSAGYYCPSFSSHNSLSRIGICRTPQQPLAPPPPPRRHFRRRFNARDIRLSRTAVAVYCCLRQPQSFTPPPRWSLQVAGFLQDTAVSFSESYARGPNRLFFSH